MDLQQISFIPKKPLTSSPLSGGGAPSILWIVGIFIFIVSIVAAVAAFGYTLYLQNRIASAKDSLDRARAAYDPTSIEDIIRLNTRIEQAKVLVAKHAAPSALFSFLGDNTLSTVRFTAFDYASNPDGSLSLKLEGNAIDFTSVALQSDQFGAAIRTLKNVLFSDVNIDPTSGIVKFNIAANVNPDLVLYGGQLKNPQTPDTATPAPATDTSSSSSASSTSGAPAPIPPQ